MKEIIYILGNTVLFVFKISLVIGITLIIIYALLNAFRSTNIFKKIPNTFKHFIFKSIEFTQIWGPNFLILYILGRLLISLLTFLGI